MPDQPIDKVLFKKRDITGLHEYPSANAEDSILVRGHHPRHWLGTTLRWIVGVFVFVAVLFGALIAALETGVIDGLIRDRAHLALSQAVGPDSRVELSSAGIRLNRSGQISLLARDVLVQRLDQLTPATRAKSTLVSLDPLALLTGKISISSVDIGGVELVAPQGDGFNLTDLAGFRVDGTDAMIEQLFAALNQVAVQVDAVEAKAFRFSDIRISGVGVPVVIETGVVRRVDAKQYQIEADIERNGRKITVTGTASARASETELSKISGEIGGLAVDFLTEGPSDRQNGIVAPLEITFTAGRATPKRGPALSIKVAAIDGTMTMGGIEADVRDARVNLVYMPMLHKIEITPSILRMGETVLPFTGGLIDADRLATQTGEGIAFDFVIDKGLAAPGDSDEAPIPFAGKAFGWFDAANRKLVAEELAVASEQGALFGSASWRFVEGISPEINLVAQAERMSTAAVKQLWPYWVGKRARQWVLENLYGGTVSNARIQLAAPAGHYKPYEDVFFNEDQLQIDFDIERARMNVAGEIPPLRDTVGHMQLRGSKITFNIASATAFFPTGRTVDVKDAVFSIPEANERPLMADLSMSVRGDADAVAELISYHPINALDKIGLQPSELSGEISSTVTARFGLINDQSPPPPVWSVNLDMRGVDIAKPVEGRMLTGMDGQLVVTPERAVLKADALVDGAPMTLDIIQPVDKRAGVVSRRVLSGTLSPADREKIAPGTGALFSGPIGFSLEVDPEVDARQLISLDLTSAKLTVPGIGWTKDKGIAAKLDFVMQTDGNVKKLSDLKLSGKGFSASGEVSLKKGQLATATFDHVGLSPRDNYQAVITRKGKGYRVKIGGASVDLRPVITLAKSSNAANSDKASAPVPVEVSGSVEAMYGYSDEKLTSGNVSYKGQGDRIDLLDFKAVTKSGQAVVMAISGGSGGETIEITSGDAGAFARFAGVYSRIRGGLLNVRLKRQDGPLRRGMVDLRNFEVVGEPRLGSLVSTPSKQDGKSLKDAVKKDIDVSQARFEVASARLTSGNGGLQLSEGIVRGPQIGASFQGQVYDANGLIDLTGTFMPAYGVNRLFSELPIIGVILGNGRDRGLIGITFRLTGKTASPLLEVNPLSVIAPGVFRSIFEFR
ncbi:MAG: YhdP family protein [Hoeflea sp.]|uniref:YhdP family protein n=1 Tax=Hoeflea sp. TaxID=1940281 RepID=UPI003EF20863